MARKKKKKRRLKKGAALVLKWSIAMIIIGTAAFFLMNMVYNRGIYVKTHPLVLDMEEDVSAEDFIETYDDTEVLVTFVDMPVHQIGKQTVEFVVENKKGRSKKYTQTLEWVHKDKTAPQINGVHNITVTIGDTVSYLDGVSAVDDVDGPVNVTVEKVSVNTRQTGTYPIAYLATDSAGNLAKVNASVTVVERAQDWHGNMELVLDRKLSEKRVFPAIDIVKSGTRREDLLLDPDELEAVEIMRKAYNGMRADEAVENILNMFARTKNNKEYIAMVKKNRII